MEADGTPMEADDDANSVTSIDMAPEEDKEAGKKVAQAGSNTLREQKAELAAHSTLTAP